MTIAIPEVPFDFERDGRAWFFSKDPTDLAAVAARDHCEAWLQPFAAWIRGEQDAVPPWDGLGVPIVAVPGPHASSEGGRLGLVTVELARAGRPSDDVPGSHVAESIANRFEVLLDGRCPLLDVVLSEGADGDSASLSIAVATLQAIFGGTLDPRFGFSGCWDSDRGPLTPPEASSIPSKLETIRRWGLHTLVVPQGAAKQSPSIDGVLAAPSDPASLLAFLVEHRILVLPGDRLVDLMVAIDVHSKSGRDAEPFLPLLERVATCEDATAAALAAGLVGRQHLHAGASIDATSCLEREQDLERLEYLPESPLKEYVLYERFAVRSTSATDLGELSDEHSDHRVVDAKIDELSGRTLSRNEEFMRFALLNTRARRFDHLGRLHEDAARLDRAWADLMTLRDRWTAIAEFATTRLGRRDTSVARVENQCIDTLLARWELAAAKPDEVSMPPEWPEVARTFGRSRTSITEVEASERFDLIGWLKLRTVLDGGVRPQDLRAAAALLGVLPNEGGASNGSSGVSALKHPSFVALEWLLRLDRDRTLPTGQLADVLEHSIREETSRDGVFRVLMLRSAAVLQLHAGRSGSLNRVPESAIASMRAMQIAVVGDGNPSGILRRCAY